MTGQNFKDLYFKNIKIHNSDQMFQFCYQEYEILKICLFIFKQNVSSVMLVVLCFHFQTKYWNPFLSSKDGPASLNFHLRVINSAHTLFMCFVFISEQTATSATYSINWLVFITEMKCLQRGTDWIFNLLTGVLHLNFSTLCM